MRVILKAFESVESSMKSLRLLLGVSALMLAAPSAEAQFPGNVPDIFRVRVGGMYAWFNTAVGFQEDIVSGGPNGGRISMEDVLRIPSPRPGFYFSGYWNFAGSSFIDFGHSGFSRGRTATLSQDVMFGDTTYTAGASFAAAMKSSLPYFDYRYGFVKTDKMQFGASLGVAFPILKAELSASEGVVGPGGPVVGQTVTKTAKLSTAAPLLGIMFDTQLTEQLSAGILFNGIFAPVHPYTGSVFFGDAHIDWYATRNFGVGAAFDYTRFSLKKENTNAIVDFVYSYYGPRLYFILTF